MREALHRFLYGTCGVPFFITINSGGDIHVSIPNVPATVKTG